MKKIEELQRREKQLLEELSRVRREIREIQLRQAEKHWEIKAGDVVKNREGKEFRIVNIRLWSFGKPWLTGNIRKKDGTWGTGLRHLYDNWEKQ